jgi:CheY-like chemotaxis protein
VPKSLLLADDSVTIQKAVEMTFRAEDVTLTVVSDGNEALSRAREAKPDLILADVGMPGLGGYELCEKVRADAGIRHIPVLLLGGGTPIDPAKAIAVGANGHMPKPFDSQKLIDQVKQILANPKAVPAAAPRPSAPVPAPARPAAPPSRPPAPSAPASRPPASGAAQGQTIQMARPPTVPGMRPAAPAPRPPGAPVAAPRPGAPVPSRPPGAVPPGARPAAQAAPRPPGPASSRPPPPAAGARPPTAKVPPVSKPPLPQAKSAPPPPREYTDRLAVPATDEEIPMEVDDIVEEAPASAHAALRAVPPPPSAKQPALSVVPGARGASADGGEALLREALSKASREVIEKIAWEVVPELAETIIREELERLMKERGA